MSDPISELGLSCPGGGTFYICQNSTQQFLGCCDDDPCADGSGECASDSLHAASFDVELYEDIPTQQCAWDSTSDYWWLCVTTSPPFLGCCAENPCTAGSCDRDDLLAAVLSSNESAAAVFLTTSSGSSSSSSTATATQKTTSSTTKATGTAGIASTSSAQSTATATALASDSESTSGTSPSHIGAITGGVVGGVLVLVLVLAFIWWNNRKGQGRHEALAQADQLECQKAQFSPYGGGHTPASMAMPPGPNGTDSLTGSPSVVGPAGTASSASNTEIYEADSIMCSSPPHSTLSWTPRDSRYMSHMSQVSQMSTGSYDMGREGMQNMSTISELGGTEISRDNGVRNQNTTGLGLNE